jgi:hypothetical protein
MGFNSGLKGLNFYAEDGPNGCHIKPTMLEMLHQKTVNSHYSKSKTSNLTGTEGANRKPVGIWIRNYDCLMTPGRKQLADTMDHVGR